MKRPLCVLAAVFLLHTGAVFFCPPALAPAVPLAGCGLCLVLGLRKDRRALPLAFCVLAGSLLSLAAGQCYLLRLDSTRELTGAVLPFRGYVSEASRYGSDTVTVLAKLPEVGDRVLRLTMEPGGPGPGDLVEGRIRVTSVREDPRGFLLSGGVVLCGRQHGALSLWQGGERALLWKAMDLRRELYARVVAAVPGEAGGVLGGMLFSYRDNIPDALSYRLDDAGLGHVLSVSGLHLSILSGLLLALCRRLRLGGLPTLFFCGVGVGAMVFAAGFSTSVLRAGLMTLLYLAARTLGRRSDGFTSLAIAAVAVSLFYPPALGELGFQLSFCATLAILLLAGPLTRWFLDRWVALFGKDNAAVRAAAGTLGVCCAAQAGVLPILGLAEGYLPTYSLPANLLASPLIFLALVLGLGGTALLLLGLGSAAAMVLGLAALPVGAMTALARFCWELPLGRIPTYFPWQRGLLAGAALILAACLPMKPKIRRRLLRLGALTAAAVCLIFSFRQWGSVLIAANPEGRSLSVTKDSRTFLVYDDTDRDGYDARMLTGMLTRAGLGPPETGLPFRGGVIASAPVEERLPGIRAGMPHAYATLVEVGGIKLLKFWAGYDIINQYDSQALWQEADIIADLDWNLYARNPEITVIRRRDGDQFALLPRELIQEGGGGHAAAKSKKAGGRAP